MPLFSLVSTSTHLWVWCGVSLGCAEDLAMVDLKPHGCDFVVNTTKPRAFIERAGNMKTSQLKCCRAAQTLAALPAHSAKLASYCLSLSYYCLSHSFGNKKS